MVFDAAMPMLFGTLLAHLRRQRGFTQSTLAFEAMVSEGTVSDIEQNDLRRIRPRTAMRIYEALAARAPFTEQELDRFNALTGLKIPHAPAPALAPRRAYSMAAAEDLLHQAVQNIGLDRVQRLLEVLAEPLEPQARPGPRLKAQG